MSSLRSQRDFRRVLKRGRRKQVGGVVIVAAEGPDGPPRVGFVVSRSVGNAVARNRARRRLRHTVYDVTLQPGMDYVIIARDSVVDAPYPSLKGWIERALEAVGSESIGGHHA